MNLLPDSPLMSGVNIELLACGSKRYVFSKGHPSYDLVLEWIGKRGGPSGYYSAQKYLHLGEEQYKAFVCDTFLSYLGIDKALLT